MGGQGEARPRDSLSQGQKGSSRGRDGREGTARPRPQRRRMAFESARVPVPVGDGVDHREPQAAGEARPSNSSLGLDQRSAGELFGAWLVPQVVPMVPRGHEIVVVNRAGRSPRRTGALSERQSRRMPKAAGIEPPDCSTTSGFHRMDDDPVRNDEWVWFRQRNAPRRSREAGSRLRERPCDNPARSTSSRIGSPSMTTRTGNTSTPKERSSS